MKEPTQEELKRFWEWCGITGNRDGWWYTKPDGRWELIGKSGQPRLTLDNLFKYTVPIAIEKMKAEGFFVPLLVLFDRWYNEIVALAGNSSVQDEKIIRLALFWVLNKVIE